MRLPSGSLALVFAFADASRVSIVAPAPPPVAPMNQVVSVEQIRNTINAAK